MSNRFNPPSVNLNERFAHFRVDDDDDDDDEEDEDYAPGENEDDESAPLPVDVQQRVDKLKILDAERSKIMEIYVAERAALEAKFHKLCEPLFTRRREIIAGLHDNEISLDSSLSIEGEVEKSIGIPNFWAKAMTHISTTAELITENDFDCLSFLEDIRCADFEDGKGFTLEFYFKENPYFTNTVLSKTYEIPNLLLADEPILKKVTGCDIDWKQGQCLTHKEVTKKQRNKSGKKAGQIRTITKKEVVESFFHFFSPPQLPQLDAEDVDEEQVQAIEDAFDKDYDVAQGLRSHVIPQAVRWFTDEAMDDEDGEEESGEKTEDSHLDMETNVPSNPFPAPPAGGENPPECKQN